MKTGRNLQDVATEILRQAQTKRDFIVPTTLMDFEYLDAAEPGPDFRLRWDNQEPMPLTRRAHEQLAGHLNIPQKFYDRLYADHPDILSFNVAELLHRQPSTRMVRTLDGNVRALLSNRYRPIDNLEIAETVLPILTDANGFHIESAEVTESRFYIKALTDRVSGEVTKGDMVQGGIVISNSEVGAGAVKVEPLVYRLVCLNGMIASDSTLRF